MFVCVDKLKTEAEVKKEVKGGFVWLTSGIWAVSLNLIIGTSLNSLKRFCLVNGDNGYYKLKWKPKGLYFAKSRNTVRCLKVCIYKSTSRMPDSLLSDQC